MDDRDIDPGFIANRSRQGIFLLLILMDGSGHDNHAKSSMSLRVSRLVDEKSVTIPSRR
jgi:hypothetical protein